MGLSPADGAPALAPAAAPRAPKGGEPAGGQAREGTPQHQPVRGLAIPFRGVRRGAYGTTPPSEAGPGDGDGDEGAESAPPSESLPPASGEGDDG